jgi:uncharacterized protein YbaP (TraB family)
MRIAGLIAFIAALFAAPASTAATAIPEVANPAIWTLKDKGGDVTFLGSVHLLPPDLKWRTPAIDAAMDRAEIVVFEAPIDPPSGGPANELMEKLGSLKGDERLRDLMTKEQYARFEDAAWAVRFPARNLNKFEPWMASVMLEVMLYVHKGFSPWAGVDHLLEEEAHKKHKTLAYLETIEEQLSFLANQPRAVGLRMLASTVEGILTKPNLVDELVAAWAHGDAAALQMVVADSMGEVPEIEDALLKQRNEKWVPKLEAMVRSGKPHLVIVGAAHLVGSESVIAKLRAKGYRIEGP